VKHLNCKLYYQQLHLKYLCNLARHWLHAPCGWHDSVETCRSVIICEIIVHLLVFFLPVALRPNAGHGPFIHEVSRSHTRHITVGRTPLDAWSVRRRDLYLTTHNTHNRQTSMPPGWIRTHNLSRRAAADPRLRPRGHWDRLLVIVPKYSVVRWVSVCIYELNYPIRFVWNSSFVVSTTKQRLDLLSSPWDRECVDYKKKILIFFFRLFTVFFFALLLPRSLHLSLHLSVIMTQLPASFVTR